MQDHVEMYVESGLFFKNKFMQGRKPCQSGLYHDGTAQTPQSRLCLAGGECH